jgi:hypothetical protein
LEPQHDELALPSGHRRYQLSDPSASDAPWSLELRPVAGFDPLDRSTDMISGPASPPQHDVTSLVLRQAPSLNRTRNWTIFDAQLNTYLTAVSRAHGTQVPTSRVSILQWPPSGILWREFGEWFVDTACRLGPDPLPFSVSSRKFRWAGLHFGWSDRSWELSGQYGWFVPNPTASSTMIPNNYGQGFIVLTDGTLWAAMDNGLYWGTGKPRPVPCDGPEMVAAAVGMLRTLVQWRTPMTHIDRVPAIEITSDVVVSRPDDEASG